MCCYLVVVHAVCEKCGAIGRAPSRISLSETFSKEQKDRSSGAGDGSNVYHLVKSKTGRASPNASAQSEGEAALFGCFH